MTTATQPKLIRVRGRYVGHTDVNKPETFLVPVSEVKPLSACRNSVPVYWAGRGREFVHGAHYTLAVDPKTWGAVDAIESA